MVRCSISGASVLGKRRKLFAALGVSVPDAEPEKKQDYEDEEERCV